MLASLVCSLAPTIETLIAARFVQALGGAGAMVLARATVRDMYDGVRVAREMSRMAAIMALAPLVAPLCRRSAANPVRLALEFRRTGLHRGGGLVHGVFAAAAGDPAAACAGTVFARLDAALQSPLLANSGFVVHLGIAVCCMAGLFAWISIAAFDCGTFTVCRRWRFGGAFAIAAAGYLIGTSTAARFVTRWGSGQTMGFGTARWRAAVSRWCLAVAIGAHVLRRSWSPRAST